MELFFWESVRTLLTRFALNAGDVQAPSNQLYFYSGLTVLFVNWFGMLLMGN